MILITEIRKKAEGSRRDGDEDDKSSAQADGTESPIPDQLGEPTLVTVPKFGIPLGDL